MVYEYIKSHDWPSVNGLRFTAYAWQKLLYMLHSSDTEVGGWGVSSEDDLLLVHDFHLVKQTCTSATTEFDQVGLAMYACEMAEHGFTPNECMRIWIHTHPGFDASPSKTDEDTARDVLGQCDWGVMLIVNNRHDTTARLRYSHGPQVRINLPVSVDWQYDHDGSDCESWAQELADNVTQNRIVYTIGKGGGQRNYAGGYYNGGRDLYGVEESDEYAAWWREEARQAKDETPLIGTKKQDPSETDVDTGLSIEDTRRIEGVMLGLGITPPSKKLNVWQDIAMYVWDYTFQLSAMPPDASRFPKDTNALQAVIDNMEDWLKAQGRPFPEQWTREWWDAADEYMTARRVLVH